MSFENYTKGNIKNNDSVNSRGIQLKNRNGFDASTMVMQYWDDKLNVILHPVLKNPEGVQVYDYEQRIMITLRLDKAMALLKAMDVIMDKAIQENKETSIAVTTGNNNMLVVGSVLKEGALNIVLTVCRELNPDTKIPGQRFSYTFIKDDEIVTGYDAKTGSFEDVLELQSEYMIFKNALQEYINMMAQAQVHSDRYFDKYYRTQLNDKVTKIGTKVGALDSKGGGYGGAKSAFANVSSNEGNYTPTTSLNDLKDIF